LVDLCLTWDADLLKLASSSKRFSSDLPQSKMFAIDLGRKYAILSQSLSFVYLA